MNIDKVISELNSKYPNKTIYKNPNEILCEVDPSSYHKSYSDAVAVIDKGAPHLHKITTETYKIVRGSLTLYCGKEKIILNTGDSYVIKPNTLHWSEGDETWVECHSEPGWVPEDHILV